VALLLEGGDINGVLLWLGLIDEADLYCSSVPMRVPVFQLSSMVFIMDSL
jgi:hypothetical protein